MSKKNGVGKYPSVNPDQIPHFKNFLLMRNEDETGTSGCGIVAVGIMFPSGQIEIEWTTVIRSHSSFHSIADLEALHGHNGKTVVQWLEK
jgi:hypothetical protein